MKDAKDGGKPHVLTSSFSLHPSAFQIWGARVALGGVFAVVPVGWLMTRGQPDDVDSWYGAGCFYALLALLVLGLGAFIAGLPELLRRGPMAKRFANAEWRNLRAKHGLTGRIIWWTVGMAGYGGLGVLLGWCWSHDDWGLRSNDFAAVMALGAVGCSLLLPIVVGASAAVNLSSSRRSGAAEHLLMGPFAADLLGWAAAGAQARRAVRVLLLTMPYYLAPALMLADDLARSDPDPTLLAACFLLGLGLLMEVIMIRRAAALGVCLGALIPRPGIAAGLAALGGMGLVVLRLILGVSAAVFADTFDHELGWELAYPTGVAFFLAAEWVSFAVLTPLFMWLARSALSAPLGLLLGQRLQRLGSRIAAWGERVEGGGRPPAGKRRIFFLRDESPDRRLLGWKAGMAAAVLAAFGLTCVFPLVGDLCGRDSAEAANSVLGALVVLGALLLLALRFLAIRVVRFLRASGGSGEARR